MKDIVSIPCKCPKCHEETLREVFEKETFPFGDDHHQIEVMVPVISCSSCGFSYTDQRSEQIRHAAICQHLGILSPERIKYIREELYGLSRRAFDEAFGLSSASIERWENGKLFQNIAADTLLRTLEDTAVGRRVNRTTMNAPVERGDDNVVWGRFATLNSDASRMASAVRRSQSFDLRTRAVQ